MGYLKFPILRKILKSKVSYFTFIFNAKKKYIHHPFLFLSHPHSLYCLCKNTTSISKPLRRQLTSITKKAKFSHNIIIFFSLFIGSWKVNNNQCIYSLFVECILNIWWYIQLWINVFPHLIKMKMNKWIIYKCIKLAVK